MVPAGGIPQRPAGLPGPLVETDPRSHRKDRERGYRLQDDGGRSARMAPFTHNLTGISHETVSFFINDLKMYK